MKHVSILLITILVALCFVPSAYSKGTYVLSEKEKEILLRISRDTLTLYLNKGTIPSLGNYHLTENLKKKRGLFVTLKKRKTDRLRGCIGYITGYKPVAEAVIDCTIQSATMDSRFLPMKKGEDKTVYIEISVMTPPMKIKNIDAIQLGKDGLILTDGFKTGVLLPQVPLEWGWNREEFLKAICRKAGLPYRAWEKGAVLKVFSAIVFSEKHNLHNRKHAD